MDSKIVELIDRAVDRLPEKNDVLRHKQYKAAQQLLCERFPGSEEYQYISKELAKKYEI